MRAHQQTFHLHVSPADSVVYGFILLIHGMRDCWLISRNCAFEDAVFCKTHLNLVMGEIFV